MEKIGVIVNIENSELIQMDKEKNYDLSEPIKKIEMIVLDPLTNKIKVVKTISHNIDNEYFIGDIVARKGRFNYITKNIGDFDYVEINQLTTIYKQLSFLAENIRKMDIVELLNSSKTLKEVNERLELRRKSSNIELLMHIDIALNSIQAAILNSYNGTMKKKA